MIERWRMRAPRRDTSPWVYRVVGVLLFLIGIACAVPIVIQAQAFGWDLSTEMRGTRCPPDDWGRRCYATFIEYAYPFWQTFAFVIALALAFATMGTLAVIRSLRRRAPEPEPRHSA